MHGDRWTLRNLNPTSYAKPGSRWRVRRIILGVGSAAFVLLGPVGCGGGSGDESADGKPTTTIKESTTVRLDDVTVDLNATCAGVGQLCSAITKIPFTVSAELESLSLTIKRGSGHCSAVAYQITLDGGPITETVFTSYSRSDASLPDAVDADLGAAATGPHELQIRGVGRPGGYNEGRLKSYGGTLTFPEGIELGRASIESDGSETKSDG